MSWFEAGESFRYDSERAIPDYLGGISFTRGLGAMLANGAHGF